MPKAGAEAEQQVTPEITFTIEYRFDGMRFRRMTPIPKEAKEILERY